MRKALPPLLLCLFALAPAAQAEGFYLGAAAGKTSAELPGGTSRVKFDSTGYKGFVGYGLMRWFAVEGAYTDFGDLAETVGSTQFEASVQILSLWGVGILPITPRLGIYAKLGPASYRTEVHSDGVAEPDQDGIDFGFGFGISYNFTEKLGLQFEWENYELDTAEGATFTSLGLRWTF